MKKKEVFSNLQTLRHQNFAYSKINVVFYSRLHTNDQLLSVNGVSLVGQSNAEAMETLRRALLHARPPRTGSITLTIARRTGMYMFLSIT